VDLEEFVSQALQEIVGGVRKANGALGQGTFTLLPGADQKAGRGIHFDVAVTTREEARTGGGIGARIAVLRVALDKGKADVSEQVSHIAFAVDVGTRLT
jgi:hypothetical protein